MEDKALEAKLKFILEEATWEELRQMLYPKQEITMLERQINF